jgi:hypothetical protein
LRLASMIGPDATASSVAAVTARSMPITGTWSISPSLLPLEVPSSRHLLVVEPDDSVHRRPGPSRETVTTLVVKPRRAEECWRPNFSGIGSVPGRGLDDAT